MKLKPLFAFLALLAICRADIPPPPEANQAAIVAGIAHNSYISPYGLKNWFTGGGVTITGTPAAGQLTNWASASSIQGITTGTNVVTALGVPVGSAGAFTIYGGDLGTPSAIVLTNATGTAASLTVGNATNTAITDDTTTNATVYPTWVTANTGNLPQKVSSTKLTFNPSTGAVQTTGTVTAGNGSANAGGIVLAQGTANAPGTTSVTLMAPTSVTSYTRTLPTAVGSTGFLLETVASTNQTETLVAGTGSGGVVQATSPTITTPTISGHFVAEGVTTTGATGTGNMVFSIAPTLTGTTTLGDATTPALLLDTGKTNTGNITIKGKTSGSLIITTADATAQAVTLNIAAQTTGAGSAIIPDLSGSSRHFAFYDLNQTWFNAQVFSTSARASGVAPYLTVTAAPDTGQTAATEAIGVSFLGATRQHASNTTVATQREIVFAAPTYSFASATGTITNAATVAIAAAPIVGTNAAITNSYSLWVQSGNTAQAGKTALYNNVATAGWGHPAIYAAGRVTAQSAANASIATYTLPAADGSFIVSANVLVTTATTHNFTVTCAYTDEGNTARTLTFTFSNVGGTLATSIINTGGTVPYEGVPLHIRCKASTAITIATAAGGVYTSVAYNAEGIIQQVN